MTEREQLLDRLTDVGKMSRSPRGLAQDFAYHPDTSIRLVLQVTAQVARRLTGYAPLLEPRQFQALCFDISRYLVDDLEKRLVDGAESGQLSGWYMHIATPEHVDTIARRDRRDAALTRADLLGLAAEVCGIWRDEASIYVQTPDEKPRLRATLDEVFKHLPDASIQEFLGWIGDIAGSLAGHAPHFDATSFGRFGRDMLSETLREIRHAGAECLVALDRSALTDDERLYQGLKGLSRGRIGAEPPIDKSFDECLVADDEYAQVGTQSGLGLSRLSFGHLAGSVVAGLAACAAGLYLRRRKVRS